MVAREITLVVVWTCRRSNLSFALVRNMDPLNVSFSDFFLNVSFGNTIFDDLANDLLCDENFMLDTVHIPQPPSPSCAYLEPRVVVPCPDYSKMEILSIDDLPSGCEVLASGFDLSKFILPTVQHKTWSMGQAKFDVLSGGGTIIGGCRMSNKTMFLCVEELLALLRVLLSDDCWTARQMGEFMSERKRYVPQLPDVRVFVLSPTLLMHWCRMSGKPILRLVRHHNGMDSDAVVYFNIKVVKEIQKHGVMPILRLLSEARGSRSPGQFRNRLWVFD